ncbi:MAG: ABC transporter substrate-binding protein [Alphaproteobacteria bacterium]|nr:MAG: ABC transporter substrate-binding protein [Alphaproteobacteria bacterium]
MFTRSAILAVALGLAAGAGASAQEAIRIGLTGALTGPVAGTYAPAVEGLRVYLEGVNARGGIGGHRIELVLQDDGAEPSRAAANARRFATQDGVVMMINSSLSSTYAPMIAEARRAGVPLLFAASACPTEVFPPADPNLFCTTGFGPRYDSRAALDFIAAMDGSDVKIAFHAMAIPISRGEIDYAETLAAERGMTPVAKEITPPPTPDYGPFADNIARAGCRMGVVLGALGCAAAHLRGAAPSGLAGEIPALCPSRGRGRACTRRRWRPLRHRGQRDVRRGAAGDGGDRRGRGQRRIQLSGPSADRGLDRRHGDRGGAFRRG